jgi:hypothetical protein
MKHPRLILWYATIVPMTISYIVISLPLAMIETVTNHLFAAKEVLDNLLMRYEMWAKYNEKGSIFNCPWKYTLREVYLNALRRDY